MITGRDKERVRSLMVNEELTCKLIKHIRDDLHVIADALKKDGINTTGVPYYMIHEDIGRCSAYIDDSESN